MKVYVATCTGMARTYPFDVEPSTTLGHLKERFREETNNNRDGEKIGFVFEDELLEGDDRSLSVHGVDAEAILQAVILDGRTYRNGGFMGAKFVDVSNNTGLRRVQWTKTGPARLIASRGLCLEGICSNAQCDAYQKRVIMGMGYRKFDIVIDVDEETTKCPLCRQYVNPTTCGFNNCWWRFEGRKQDGANDNMPPRRCSCDWQQADNAYHYFDELQSGSVVWKQLVVEAVKNRPA